MKKKRATKMTFLEPFDLCHLHISVYNDQYPVLQDPDAGCQHEKADLVEMMKLGLMRAGLDCDIAAFAYLLSLALLTHDESTLLQFGLDPLKLSVIGERFRNNKVWLEGGEIVAFANMAHVDLIANVGRGILNQHVDAVARELSYTFTSPEAAESWRVRGGHSPAAEKALVNDKIPFVVVRRLTAAVQASTDGRPASSRR